MALRNLTIHEMIGVSASWTSSGKDGSRPVFESVPALTALLPALDGAHSMLVRAESPNASTSASAELTAITGEALVQDSVHDRYTRGGIKVVEALIELVGPDSPEGKHYGEIRDTLYPDGAATTGQSYVAESGNALRVQKALDSDAGLRDEIAEITIVDKKNAKKYSLLTIVKGQIKAGAALGQLEAKRTALFAAAPDAAASQKAPPTLSEARNAWMGVVGDLVRLAKYAPESERKAVEAALLHLQRVEKAADARAARRGAAALATDAEGADATAKEPGPKPA